uniref:Putative ovule protein n=1 Tax=Solanum chacoense TaxID=4108 RepID=A0A0V0GR68_SOLCH
MLVHISSNYIPITNKIKKRKNWITVAAINRNPESPYYCSSLVYSSAAVSPFFLLCFLAYLWFLKNLGSIPLVEL